MLLFQRDYTLIENRPYSNMYWIDLCPVYTRYFRIVISYTFRPLSSRTSCKRSIIWVGSYHVFRWCSGSVGRGIFLKSCLIFQSSQIHALHSILSVDQNANIPCSPTCIVPTTTSVSSISQSLPPLLPNTDSPSTSGSKSNSQSTSSVTIGKRKHTQDSSEPALKVNRSSLQNKSASSLSNCSKPDALNKEIWWYIVQKLLLFVQL